MYFTSINEEVDLFIDMANEISLNESLMNELGYEIIQEIYDILLETNMGANFLHRVGNMWQSHRKRDSYSHAKPYYRNSSKIYRLEDQMKDQQKSIESGDKNDKHNAESNRLQKIYDIAKNKLGEDHPYTKKKKEELSNHNSNKESNFGMGNSTNKKLNKRYNLMQLDIDGEIKKGRSIEGVHDAKSDKTIYKQIHGNGPTDLLKDKSREGRQNFSIPFESHHRKLNVRAEQARDRFERYLNGERKHLQRDKNGNIIKNSNGKPLCYYDNNDRDEKTGEIIKKAKSYSDEEYGKEHDKNTATKVNPARERLLNKRSAVGMPVFNLSIDNNGQRNISSTKQYNSKTGKLDSQARAFKRFHIRKHEDNKGK